MDIFFSDINLKMLKTSEGDVSKLINEDSIKQSIKLAVMVSAFEWKFDSGGSEVYKFLFENINIDNAYFIKDEVEISIKEKVGRIDNLTVEVIPVPDNEEYIVNVFYVPSNKSEKEKVSIILNRLR